MNENLTVESVDEMAEIDGTENTMIDETPAAVVGEVTDIEGLVREVVEALPETVSPYQIHSVINTVFEVLGSERTVRPQMMYNYDRNGLIVKGAKGVKRYAHEEVVAFATKFVTKHTTK